MTRASMTREGGADDLQNPEVAHGRMYQDMHRVGLHGLAAWLHGALAGNAADPVQGRRRADPLYRPVQRGKLEGVPRPRGRVDACLLSQGYVPQGTGISDR